MTLCGALVLAHLWNLADDDAGWVSGGTLNQWTYGVPPGGSTPVWATRLGGNTFNDTTETLDIALPDVSGLERAVLVLSHELDLGLGDTASFSLDTGSGFQAVSPIGGYPGGGEAFVGSSGGRLSTGILLTGAPTGAVLRLSFEADASGAGPGWTVYGMELYDGDPIPPVVTLSEAPADNQNLLGPHRVVAQIEEDHQLISATVRFESGQGSGEVVMAPTPMGYVAELPAFPPDTTVSFQVEAADCAATGSATGDPFRVYLAAPSELAGPVGPHVVERQSTLSWEAPDSPWPVEGYVVEELASGTLIEAEGTLQAIPLDPAWEQTFRVRALYDTPMGPVLGDASAELELAVEVPQLFEPRPATVFPGEQVYVDLSGQSLYLLDGLTTVRILPDIEASSVEVQNVDRARALLTIPRDAQLGFHHLEINGTQGVLRFDNRIEVLDGALAPAIIEVEPSSIVQGGAAEIVFRASRAFEEPVEILLTEDLILASQPVVSGDRLTVSVVAIGASRPGEHPVIIDDGRRLYVTAITIDEYRVPTRQGCSTSSAPQGAVFLAGMLLIGIRRRLTHRDRIRFHQETP